MPEGAVELAANHSSMSTETFLSDFLLTHSVFMSSSQLCAALLHQYPSGLPGGLEEVWRREGTPQAWPGLVNPSEVPAD